MAHPLKRRTTSKAVAEAIGLAHVGENKPIASVEDFLAAGSGSLSFTKGDNFADRRDCTIARLPSPDTSSNSFIVAESPRLTFALAVQWIIDEIGFSTWDWKSEIHPTAVIGSHVVIHDGVRIGANVILEDNAVIRPGTVIGSNSTIGSNSSIGTEGFGFERDAAGIPVRFPQIGGVAIGSHVEVGSLCLIARGALTNTVLEDYVKVDSLVHIAHNCHIEKGAFLIACCELSGGVRIGQRSWIGPNASLLQKVHVGDDALIGIGAVVRKDVPSGTVWVGNPARQIHKTE